MTKDINLIPEDYIKERLKLSMGIYITAALVFIAFILVLNYAILFGRVKFLKNESANLTMQISVNNIEALENELKTVDTKKADNEKKMEFLNQLNRQDIRSIEIINGITKAMPRDVYLTNMNYSRYNGMISIILEGKSLSIYGVSDFYMRLQEIPIFHDIKMNPIKRSEDGYYTYSFNFTVY